jgi:hypothetical protein
MQRKAPLQTLLLLLPRRRRPQPQIPLTRTIPGLLAPEVQVQTARAAGGTARRSATTRKRRARRAWASLARVSASGRVTVLWLCCRSLLQKARATKMLLPRRTASSRLSTSRLQLLLSLLRVRKRLRTARARRRRTARRSTASTCRALTRKGGLCALRSSRTRRLLAHSSKPSSSLLRRRSRSLGRPPQNRRPLLTILAAAIPLKLLQR